MRTQNKCVALCGAAGLLAGQVAYGVIIEVPADRPTIQAGIDAATQGDIVLVEPGIYPERIDLRGKAIVLQSRFGAAETVINGGSVGPVISMTSGEGPATVVQGFTIKNGLATFGAGIFLSGTSPVIADNIFLDNATQFGGFGAAIGGFSASPIIENNEVFGNACDQQGGALAFREASSPMVFDNVIRDNACRGVEMQSLSADANPFVFNNTVVNNQGGIFVDNTASAAGEIYRNNLIAQNGIGLEVANPSAAFDAIWTNNLVFGNTTNFSGTIDPTGTNGNLSADPLFADAANRDFHVLPGSPAIDAGTNGVPLPATDFDGQPRVQDGNGDGAAVVDIGAYEAAANHPPLAAADTATTVRNRAVTIAVLANDSDVDGDALALVNVSSPAHGTAAISGASIVYTPTRNFVGTDQFNYLITDGRGANATATVTVSVLKK